MATSLSLLFTTTTILLSILWAQAQAQLPAPSPASASCNGIFLSYTHTTTTQIPPTLRSNPTRQPYRFESTLFIINNGLEELKSWRAFVGFQHDEYLVSASNAVLVDGNTLPGQVGNGTVFAGFPGTDLKTSIETAGDVTQISARLIWWVPNLELGHPEFPCRVISLLLMMGMFALHVSIYHLPTQYCPSPFF